MDFEEKKLLEEKNKKINDLLFRVKKINEVYNSKNITEKQRCSLIENSQFIIDQLEKFGFEKVFTETLLISGKDFVESFFCEERNLDIYGITKLIFG